jgi:hypothetical protein
MATPTWFIDSLEKKNRIIGATYLRVEIKWIEKRHFYTEDADPESDGEADCSDFDEHESPQYMRTTKHRLFRYVPIDYVFNDSDLTTAINSTPIYPGNFWNSKSHCAGSQVCRMWDYYEIVAVKRYIFRGRL